MANSNYCATFRIADKSVNGKSYSDRYNALISAMRSEGMGYWEETTSFFVVESPHNTTEITARGARSLSAADDLLLVFDPTDMSACYFGTLEHVDVLRSFFPKLKKVG